MNLPKFIATTGPPRGTGLVRAQDIDALTRTGAAEFEEIERAGGAIQQTASVGVQAYMHRRDIDDITEAGKVTQSEQTLWNQAEEEVRLYQPAQDIPLPDDPNFLKTLRTFGVKESDEYLGRLLKDIDKNTGKIFSGIRNPKTKAQLVTNRNARYADNARKLKGELRLKLHAYQMDEMNKLANDAARNGESEVSDFYIDKLKEHDLITPRRATQLKEHYGRIATREPIIEVYRAGSDFFENGNVEAGEAAYEEARQMLEASDLSNEDKESLDDEIDTDQRAAKGKFKIAGDAKVEEEMQAVDEIFILPQAEFLTQSTNALKAVNDSTILTVKQKEGQRKKINKRINAIKGGKIDPVDLFDPTAYERLAIAISRNSKSVKSIDISNLVGIGEIGGLTTSQAEELTRLKKFYDGADVIGNSLHRTHTGAITGLKTAKAFSRNKIENVRLAAKARSVLDAWAVKNPDATEADYTAFFDRLIDNSRMNTWGRGWFTRESEENRIAIRENLAELEREVTGDTTRAYKEGDTRTIGGITYTFDGTLWSD